MIPAIGLLITTFRSRDGANSSGWQALAWQLERVGQLVAQDCVDVMRQTHLAGAFVNSIVIAVPATVIPILIAAFAAYVVSVMDLPARAALLSVVVGLLTALNYVTVAPLLETYGDVRLNGPSRVAWLFHAGLAMSLAIHIVCGYLSTLPSEVLESAKIDGASHFTVFLRLIIPLSAPALAGLAIFQFLWACNDLLVALASVGPESSQALGVAVHGALGRQGQGWRQEAAGGFVSMIVPIMVFQFLQRYVARGVRAGPVKG